MITIEKEKKRTEKTPNLTEQKTKLISVSLPKSTKNIRASTHSQTTKTVETLMSTEPTRISASATHSKNKTELPVLTTINQSNPEAKSTNPTEPAIKISETISSQLIGKSKTPNAFAQSKETEKLTIQTLTEPSEKSTTEPSNSKKTTPSKTGRKSTKT